MLNSGSVLKVKLSGDPKIKKAKPAQRYEWRSTSCGIGVQWESLDEDLSLKGFLKSSALNQMLRSLKGHDNDEMILV